MYWSGTLENLQSAAQQADGLRCVLDPQVQVNRGELSPEEYAEMTAVLRVVEEAALALRHAAQRFAGVVDHAERRLRAAEDAQPVPGFGTTGFSTSQLAEDRAAFHKIDRPGVSTTAQRAAERVRGTLRGAGLSTTATRQQQRGKAAR